MCYSYNNTIENWFMNSFKEKVTISIVYLSLFCINFYFILLFLNWTIKLQINIGDILLFLNKKFKLNRKWNVLFFENEEQISFLEIIVCDIFLIEFLPESRVFAYKKNSIKNGDLFRIQNKPNRHTQAFKLHFS
jgi:hypothetical protein